ncbi:MAG: NifU family protein [Verrucomicrobia bacterium]|nr:NifU family protein [Cytophagales bacterium]
MENLVEKVERALESIRPYLNSDGGDVKIVNISEDNTVLLELMGACGTCPMSTMTMKAGVEEAIKKFAPEVKAVLAINADPD